VSPTDIVDGHVSKLIRDTAQTYLGFPTYGRGDDKSALVIIECGEASTNAIVLMNRGSGDIVKLSRFLDDEAAQFIGSGTKVEYFTNDTYSEVKISESHTSPGRMMAESHVRIGAFIAAVKRFGLTPYVLLGIPAYANISYQWSTLPKGEGIYRYYTATQFPPDERIDYRVRLKSGYIALFAVCLLFPLLFCAITLRISAFLAGRVGSRSIGARYGQFQNGIWIGTFTAAWACYGITMAMTSFIPDSLPSFAAILDLWVGRDYSSLIALSYGIGLFSIIMHAIASNLLESRLFYEVRSSAMMYVISPKELDLFKRMNFLLRMVQVAMMIGFLCIAMLLSRFSFAHHAVMYLFGLTIEIERQTKAWMEKRLAKIEDVSDPSSAAREGKKESVCQQLGKLVLEMGCGLIDVEFDSSFPGRVEATVFLGTPVAAHLSWWKGVSVTKSAKVIIMSRLALDILSPAEIDFVLARELAGLQDLSGKDADLLALKVTKNLAAAESAVRKLTPDVEEKSSPWGSTSMDSSLMLLRPEVSNRLDDLKRSARELGVG